MKVSLAWLQALVDIHLDGRALADTLTRGGIEVGGIEHLGKGCEDVWIGEIKALTKHPDADKLQICQIDIGTKTLPIVTGANNLQVGDKVPVAVEGAHLPNGLRIKRAKLRGVQSEGMLCSTEELLLDAALGGERSQGGIWILAEDAPVGGKLAAWLGQEDTVLELDLYPNRPDCLAMVNIARETASLTGAALHLPDWAQEDQYRGSSLPVGTETGTLSPIPGVAWTRDCAIEIDDPDLCWRYAGLLVEDVRIAPSPDWLQQRLQAAGVRAINNIVDITNYCMLEMGQPLHAFDRDKITGTVRVRRARAGETLTTLDHVERTLEEGMLLITDDAGPLALAGVMGGLQSEVTSATRRLFVESAHFAGVSIRRTSRRVGLASEAAARFEKGVNPYGAVATLARVAELLLELQAGRPVGLVDTQAYLPALPRVNISVRHTSELLGYLVQSDEIEKILRQLGLVYQKSGTEEFSVEIPSYRSDLRIEEDLIEEVARITGYERIPTTLPQGSQTQGRRTQEQEIRRQLRHLLVGAGMHEVLTYSFARVDQDALWGEAAQAIPLLNPLRDELRTMRTALLPGLLDIASRNRSRRNMDLSIFEIGSVYQAKSAMINELPNEILRLAGVVMGKTKKHWHAAETPYDFYYVKGLVEAIAWKFHLTFHYHVPERSEVYHPGRSAEIWLGNAKIGMMGEMHPLQEKQWDLERAIVLEIDLRPLLQKGGAGIRVSPIPRFPAILRDLSLVVREEIPAVAVNESMRKLGGILLQQVELFDVYAGKSVPDGYKSLTFSLRYQSLDETLTDAQVNKLNERILAGIQQEFGAQQRN
ncbi:MAG: phenylalanine--tRNA ligase subunit beta [Peptococcaceae bacterium]|jgi:phenylalanyl-tRNA synthetase beta chain|nr:phenylalanine--tRNA ligase subunit beta [Peptococcaceae bacterium]